MALCLVASTVNFAFTVPPSNMNSGLLPSVRCSLKPVSKGSEAEPFPLRVSEKILLSGSGGLLPPLSNLKFHVRLSVISAIPSKTTDTSFGVAWSTAIVFSNLYLGLT